MSGMSMIAGSGSSYAMVILELKKWDERKGVSNKDVITSLFKKTSGIRDAHYHALFSLPTIKWLWYKQRFLIWNFRTKEDILLHNFIMWPRNFLAALSKRPWKFNSQQQTFNPNFPQYLLSVDVPKIKEAGLRVNDVMDAMQGYFGGIYVDNFNQFGKQYRIMIQSDAAYRANPEELNKVYVRTGTNKMAPITEIYYTY